MSSPTSLPARPARASGAAAISQSTLRSHLKSRSSAPSARCFWPRPRVCDTCQGSGATHGDRDGDLHALQRRRQSARDHQLLLRHHHDGPDRAATAAAPAKSRKKSASPAAARVSTKSRTEIEIAVPAGIEGGEMIRLSGAGEAARAAIGRPLCQSACHARPAL